MIVSIKGATKDCNLVWSFLEWPAFMATVNSLHLSVVYTCTLSGNEDFLVVFQDPSAIRDLDGNPMEQSVVRLRTRAWTSMSTAAKKGLEAAGSSLSVASLLTLLMFVALLAFQYWVNYGVDQ